MPGPGYKKGKAKPKQTQVSCVVSSEGYVTEVEKAEDWEAVVYVLCGALQIPDLLTRKGLEKAQKKFDAIYRRLEEAYATHPHSTRLKGGVVAIYARMCIDPILQNKLIGRGVLKRLISLLDADSTRHLALRALAMIARHADGPVKTEIAEHTSVLTRLAKRFHHDQAVMESVIAVFSHTIPAVIEHKGPPNPRLPASIDMTMVLKVIAASLRNESASIILIDDALSMLADVALKGSNAFKTCPWAVLVLVAGLRSKDWITRITSLRGLIRLHDMASEPDVIYFNPKAHMARVMRGFPGHLQRVLEAYGLPRCDSYVLLQAHKVFFGAMLQCANDRDLRALGLKLGECIMLVEHSVPEGHFEEEDVRTRKRRNFDNGLPFTLFRDSLPVCAEVLRSGGVPVEADIADVLDIKYLFLKQREAETIAIARKGLTRNPDFAYFHFVLAQSDDSVEGLRAAKKGLKCKNVSPYLRFSLLKHAVDHATGMGMVVLDDGRATNDQAKWEEGIAYFMSAYEDAKTFVREAPPDNRHRLWVGYWYILLAVTINESLSLDLRELQDAIDGQKKADQFLEWMGVHPPESYMRLAQQTVTSLYTPAMNQYGNVLMKPLTVPEDEQESPREKLCDDLAAWLEAPITDGESPFRTKPTRLTVSGDHLDIYQCSWCSNVSAALTKCDGCPKARYCDSECQRSHFPDHKECCGIAV